MESNHAQEEDVATTVVEPRVEIRREEPPEIIHTGADETSLGEDVLRERWVVKLHPDTGQCYFVDSMEEVSTWRNPFVVDHLGTMLESIDQGPSFEDTRIEVERLAGLDDVPNRDVFCTPYMEWTTSRLAEWIQHQQLELGDDYGTMLSYPEYLDISRNLDDFKIDVNIRLPQSFGVTASKTRRFEGAKTVGEAIDEVLSQLKKLGLQTQRTDVFILKAAGYQDYMLHASYPLGFYDCAYHACRLKQRLDLVLIKLAPAELMDLGSILSLTLEEYTHRQMECCENALEWCEEEDFLVPRAMLQDTSMQKFIPKKTISWPLRVRVVGLRECPTDIPCDFIRVEVNIYFNGSSLLDSSSQNMRRSVGYSATPGSDLCIATPDIPFGKDLMFPNIWINTKLDVANLPATARIAFMIVGTSKGPESVKVPLAGVSVTLVDYCRQLVSGKMTFKLFPHETLQVARDPIKFKGHDAIPDMLNLATCVPVENGDATAGVLTVEFDSYSAPVIAEIPTLAEVEDASRAPYVGSPGRQSFSGVVYVPTADEIADIHRLEKKDTLYELKSEEITLLWKCRNYCSQYPKLLGKFLLTVSWMNAEAVEEAHRCLVIWSKPTPLEALGMLDIRYSDPLVREYAVNIINTLSDSSFEEIMLQLVQVLKYEAFHDSPLARMLLRRALMSPLLIGHNLFWMLRSEMHCPGVLQRFGAVLLAYLHHCGPHRISLRKQSFVNDKIKVIADQIKAIAASGKNDEESLKKAAQAELELLNPNLPSKFCVCLTPRIECRSIKVQKCKVMTSKKMPLWIVFENADPYGKDYYTIYKSGDDLRQDQLTLQLLRIMDSIWRGEQQFCLEVFPEETSIDLRLKPYKCCSTGRDLGMIEVVVDSNTTANIQTEYGGHFTGALMETPIDAYLRQNNPPEKYNVAVENFVRTCAGYCVATYVLGIGDRHADNIMVAKSGHLFHIDFGHFLGNFKSKFGINRERAPFVFTPEMAYVMRDTRNQGATYKDFEGMCCRAYNMLRRRADIFIHLFLLMVPAAMPELLRKSDITYLREQLSLELMTHEADAKFIAEIKHSLRTVSRRIDNWLHNLKHKKKK